MIAGSGESIAFDSNPSPRIWGILTACFKWEVAIVKRFSLSD